MCGYCTERAVLAQHLAALETGIAPHVDPLLLPVHLQEARDWRQVWTVSPAHDDLVATLVMLCRAWSDHVLQVPGLPLHTLLPAATHARLRDWLGTLGLPVAWAWLEDDTAPLPDVLPLQDARDELDAYLGGWLRVGDHLEPAWDEARLHERLLRVSVALDLLLHAAPDDERILLLALSSPGATSPFSAIDLWLQRQATGAVIAHHGVAFILPLLGRCRSATLLASVLRGELDQDALHALHGALARRPDDGTEGTRELRIAIERQLTP